MINPSSSGWIDKFFSEQDFSLHEIDSSVELFYQKIRNTGFIYGHVVCFETPKPINIQNWIQNEIPKVALLNSLFSIYSFSLKNYDKALFITKTLSFYNEIDPQQGNLFSRVFLNNKQSLNLEKIIDDRVKTNTNIINKNFSHIITNAFLFMDVLAFHQYLVHGELPEKYFKKMEETANSLVSLALKIKTNKSNYDDLLIKLFEASVRYSKFSKINIQNLAELNLDYFDNELEKYYLLDIAGMALWSDGQTEEEEALFLHKVGNLLGVSISFVDESIRSIDDFISTNKKNIPYFNYSNPVKHFYDQTTESVITLISRNKTRLAKEIIQSKELMILLAYSTTRDLDEKEKKKVKNQLLDICKTIPSLTIFLLPGGSLLLPILIKFIPKLLPSAFNENFEEIE